MNQTPDVHPWLSGKPMYGDLGLRVRLFDPFHAILHHLWQEYCLNDSEGS